MKQLGNVLVLVDRFPRFQHVAAAIPFGDCPCLAAVNVG
jgi:hypothetical protein